MKTATGQPRRPSSWRLGSRCAISPPMSTSSSSVPSATMADFRLTWALSGTGWADCTVGDEETQAQGTASYITAAPEELLAAVTRLVLGEAETRAQFEAEP